MTTRIASLVLGTATAVALLTACSGGGSGTVASTGGTSPQVTATADATPGTPTPVSTPSGPDTATEPAAVVHADGSAWEHVHALALDGRLLVVGTHRGLWSQEPGEDPRRVSDVPFDVMGLSRDGQRWLSSGHPAPDQDAPSDLGLQASTDGGVTWTPVSLYGEVDFHRLTSASGTVMGMSAHDGRLLRSTDGGSAWDDLGTPPLFDLALDPARPRTVVATTEDGPVRSDDGGRTFEPIRGAPLLAFLAWTDSALYGLAPDGVVHLSRDAGSTWTRSGDVGDGRPLALAADGDAVVALAGDVVVESLDAGASFTPRLVIGGDDH